MTNGLDGKIAVITGAASGIGLATSEAFMRAGATVVMADRNEAALKPTRAYDIYSLIRQAVVPQRPCDPPGGVLGIPR